eukprot:TRINITY_DN15_c1_g3_i1.p1 TRINITY_DN15_c1_g3~~TRINITY_DN15_c1_g3_i1.p1  ORF type:complete len:255 (+),score=39.74 TRINITY_DN15_c1_g3_i1:183-947(+)
MSHLEVEILELTNHVRVQNGLPSLQWHQNLADIAKSHAAAVADGRAPFSHAGAKQRFASCTTKCVNVAENLARSDGFGRNSLAEATVSSWCESQGHRRNLLGPFDVCGVGWAASDSGVIFVTQLLALLDERSKFRNEVSDKVKTAAISTPAICSVAGLVIGGPVGAVCGALGGGALEYKFGVKAASIPHVVMYRMRGLYRQRACFDCGAGVATTSSEDGATSVQLFARSSDGRLLCERCCRQEEDDENCWCYVD